MGAAPYEWNMPFSDDGSFAFTFVMTMTDDSAFPWDEITSFEYEISSDTCGGGFTLTEADGITVDPLTNSITLAKADPHGLRVGVYRHGLRMTHQSGLVIPIFDGTMNVQEGNFR